MSKPILSELSTMVQEKSISRSSTSTLWAGRWPYKYQILERFSEELFWKNTYVAALKYGVDRILAQWRKIFQRWSIRMAPWCSKSYVEIAELDQ